MAILASKESGNFTAATTWNVVDPVSYLNNPTNTTASTVAYVESQSFIPGPITLSGVAIRLNGATGSGNFIVRLAVAGVTVPGTEVTIATSDLNINSQGFVFMRFAAPITLLPAISYTISARSTVSSSVSISRNATAGNWNRMLVTTTIAAPAATDTLHVLGEHLSPGINNIHTVIMDNTAPTVFSSLNIEEKGILDSATAISTNYQLIINGNININGNAIFQIGTSTTPIPGSSSFILQLNQSGVNVNFGIIIIANGVFRTFGDSKIGRAYLAADAAIGSTTLTTNITTNWLSGEEVVIAPTTATSTQLEVRTLSANAVSTTLTVPALTFAHQGTGDFIAEIANLTRNIKIRSDSASFGTYVICSPQTVVDLNYTELTRMGSATVNRRGINVNTTILGSFSIVGCSFHRFQPNGIGLLINQTTNANITITDNVFFNIVTGMQTSIANEPFTIEDCWFFSAPPIFNHSAGTLININTTASPTGITLGSTDNNGLTISNIISHSNSGTGIGLSAASARLQFLVISNLITWRNLRGLNTNLASNVIINNHTSYGNTFSGISINNSNGVTIENSTYYGSTSIIQPNGVVPEAIAIGTSFNNCTFGLSTPHSNADVVFSGFAWNDIKFNNCLFNSTVEVAGLGNLQQNVFVGSSRHNQMPGVHRNWKRTAIISSDSIIQATSPLSVRIAPSVNTTKTNSIAKGFAIPSGLTATVSVLVRRSIAGDGTAYNGSLPRLWLRQNNSAGITNDILLATATVASLGSFEALIGSIPAATDNTVNYVYLDCDGTAGWINVDKWSLIINNGSANATNINFEDYWQDGQSYLGVNTTLTNNTNQETYWLNGQPVQQLYPVSAIQTGRFFLLFD